MKTAVAAPDPDDSKFNRIAAHTVVASQLSVNSVTASSLPGGIVSSGTISANSITISYIKAGTQ